MNKRNMMLVSLLAVVAVIGAIIGILIYPTMKEILDLNRRITQEKASLESRYFLRQKVRSTIEHLSEVKIGMPALRSTVVEHGREVALVESIERLAELNGVEETLRLVPPQSGPKDYARKLVAEISLSGDPRGMGKFLSDLERMEPMFVTTGLIFRKNKDVSAVTAILTGWVSWPEALPQG